MNQIYQDVAICAAKNVVEIMEDGGKKPRGIDWREESVSFHIYKGIRHAITYMLIRDGAAPPTGENHMELAACRFEMALYMIRNTH